MLSSVPARLLITSYLYITANGLPAPLPVPAVLSHPGLLSSAVNTVGTVGSSLTTAVLNALTGPLNSLSNPKPTSTPKSTDDVFNFLKSHYANNSTGLITNSLAYTVNGLYQPNNPGAIQGFTGSTIETSPAGINSFNNSNTNPPKSIYPQADSNDAPYSLTEAELRGAIYIPPHLDAKTAKNPVLLLPGTGAFGGTTFAGNFIKILSADPTIGEPIWVNVPKAMLDDAQVNSEYFAYAINYVSAITGGKKINIVGWSQANLDAQWVFAYWPSARTNSKQLISISPDFHGTVLANLIDIGTDLVVMPTPPSILQQEYNSAYVTNLRGHGGASAYVPTSTFYSSIFDEIVQPQSGTGASAYILDTRHVGVSNNEIQTVCGIGTPAGTFGTHESLLFNGFVVTAAVQALRSGGPANTSEINLETACSEAVYPGLDLTDVLAKEATLPIAGLNILEYIANGDGVTVEPSIRAYAQEKKASF